MSSATPRPAASALPAPEDAAMSSLGASTLQPQQLILAALLLLEIFVFSMIGENFQTWGNFYEILRLSVELGLLALAMTPIIVTGGIDLSLGSLLGLSAIVLGVLNRGAHLPLNVAIIGVLLLGIIAGGINALLITRLRVPALIVTLGTMSLYRGLAEGIAGTKNYTKFDPSFIVLGQRYIGDIAPGSMVARMYWAVLIAVVVGLIDAPLNRLLTRYQEKFRNGSAILKWLFVPIAETSPFPWKIAAIKWSRRLQNFLVLALVYRGCEMASQWGIAPQLVSIYSLFVAAFVIAAFQLLRQSRISPKVAAPGIIAIAIAFWLLLHRSAAGRFLMLQADAIPAQVPLFVAAGIGCWLLLHRSRTGRALCAIGYAPDGARYAGIPVARRVGLIYVLAGLASAVAGILYTAHWGQAKADAGTGYELEAITAVVLGGTSIFGGRGSVLGTLIGLFAIAVLKKGLLLTQLPPEIVDGVSGLIHHLPRWLGGGLLAKDASIGASLPAELADILTGVLLLIAIGLDFKPGSRKAVPQSTAAISGNEEFDMKNSQVAVLSVVMLLAAAIIAGSNYWLIRSMSPAVAVPKKITIAMMPKSKGNAYFIACRKGADEAARELGVDLIWDGPTSPDPAKQNEVVEAWITRKVDVIAVACENGDGIADVLAKARAKGIKVITWDADTQVASRDFFVNQATPEDIGTTLMDNAAKVMGGKGEFAIISASTTASNMIAWRKSIERRRAEKYPDMTMVAHEACDDKQEIAFDQTRAILSRYPNVKVIMAICSPAAPGAAEAVAQSKRTDVKVVGVSLPNANKVYVKSGVTDDIVLWKTQDLGYLAVLAAYDLQTGKLRPGDTSMDGERIGKVEIQKDGNIILGKPFTFTKDNIDQFDF